MSDNMTNSPEGSRGDRNVHMPHIRSRRHPLPSGGVPPTAAEAAEFNAGTATKSWDERFAGNLVGNKKLITTIAAGGVVGGLQVGHIINQDIPNIPAIYSSIDAGVHRAINTLRGSHETPPVFDNKATGGIIGANNEQVVTDLESIPSFDSNNKPILLFPIKSPPADLQLSYQKDQGTVFFSPDILAKAQQDGTHNTITLSSVPAGTEFIASMDARIFTAPITCGVGGQTCVEPNGTVVNTGIRVMFESTDGNLYQLFVAPDFGQQLMEKRFDMNVDASVLASDLDWKKGTEVKKGTVLFTTTKNTGIRMFMQSYPISDLNNIRARTPGDIKFATDPTTSKIIVAK